MPRCAKIVRGKRCKAYTIAGSKFCLFHTPGQGMRRSNKKKNAEEIPESKIGYDESGRKKFWRRTTENQIAVRGSKALGAYLVARGTSITNKPDYTVKVTHHKARYNVQGKVMVAAHTQRTIEPTRSDWGRNFQQTDHRAKVRKRKRAGRYVASGRIIPVLGYGFMAYNVMGQPTGIKERRPGEGWVYADLAYAAEGMATEGMIRYQEGGTPLAVVDGILGAPQGLGMADSVNLVSERMVTFFG